MCIRDSPTSIEMHQEGVWADHPPPTSIEMHQEGVWADHPPPTRVARTTIRTKNMTTGIAMRTLHE